MRKSILFALVLPFASPALAGDGTVHMPGFSYVQPMASGWEYVPFRALTVARDGSRFGVFVDRYHRKFAGEDGGGLFAPLAEKVLGPAARKSADVVIRAAVVPVTAATPEAVSAMLAEELDRRLAEANQPEWENVSGHAVPASIDGARCLRWEGTASQKQVFGPMAIELHRLICAHPDFPAYVIFAEFRLRDGDDTFRRQGMAVLDSLKLTSLGYRGTYIPVGTAPQVMAEAEGALWLTYGGAGEGRVGRLDPKTNAFTDHIPVPAGPVGLVADATGLWVASQRANSVSKIDPKTKVVVKTIPVGAGPLHIASGFGSIWVTLKDAGQVARIDPATGSVTEIAGVGKEPSGIVAAGDAVYVSDFNAKTIARIDPATNKIVGKLKSDDYVSFLMWDGRHLWGTSQKYEAAVLRMDPSAPAANPVRYERVGYKPSGMAMFNGQLFVPNWDGSSVALLDPGDPNKLVAVLPGGESPIWVLSAQGAVWVVASGTMRPNGVPGIIRFDPK